MTHMGPISVLVSALILQLSFVAPVAFVLACFALLIFGCWYMYDEKPQATKPTPVPVPCQVTMVQTKVSGQSKYLNTRLNHGIRTVDEILELLDEKGGQFDFVNVLTAFHRIGVLSNGGKSPWIFQDPRFKSLVGMVEHFVNSKHPEVEQLRLLQTVWACAKMGMSPTTTMLPYSVYTSSLPKLEQFQPSQITSLLLAYVHMAPPAPAWREEANGDTLFRQTEATEWMTDLFLRAAAVLRPRINSINNKDLTNVLSAFSKAMRNSSLRTQETEPEGKLAAIYHLFRDLAQTCQQRAVAFSPREMSNAASAVVEVKTLGEQGLQKYLTALADASTKNNTVESSDASDLSMLVSAIGRVTISSPGFFKAVVERYSKRGFGEHESHKVHGVVLQATNLTLACLSAGMTTPVFMRKAVDFIRPRLRRASLEELCRILLMATQSIQVREDREFLLQVVLTIRSHDLRHMGAHRQQRLLKTMSSLDLVDDVIYETLSTSLLRRPNVKQSPKQVEGMIQALGKMKSSQSLSQWTNMTTSADGTEMDDTNGEEQPL